MKEIIKSLKPHPIVIVVLALLAVGLLAYTASIKKGVSRRNGKHSTLMMESIKY